MAWFPCIIGGGSPEPTPIPVSMNVKTTSTSGYTASVELTTYDDSRDVVYSTVMGESNSIVFGAVRLYYDSAWYLKAFTTCEYDGNTYDEGDLISTWSYAVNVDMKIDYTVPARGNATMKQGTFVSASSQFGIVDVNCGFEPDLVMVKLPFTGGDTTSYWEKGMSWAETKSIWNLYPAETVVYVVDLGRQSGETGIQAINNNGFSFMSNGGNTQGVTCEYIAVKYEIPQPTPVIPFEKEILHSIVQDQSGSPVPVSVTFTEDYQIAFICGLIGDNVRTGAISVNAIGGASELYGMSQTRYASAGIAIQLPSNKTLTGYFPYSDGGAYYNIFGAIGMSRLPSEYEIEATIDTSNISIELSKVYDHIVVFVGMDSGNSNSITLTMNGTSIPLTVESEKFSRYSYHASEELTSDSATLNFTYSGGTVNDNTIVVFAYNE